MGKRGHGKRYRADTEKVPDQPQPVPEAVAILKQFNHTKFDQTVELAVWLAKRVVAFCEDSQVELAREAGAIEAGGDELIRRIQDGWTDFDVTVAVPAMMRSVSRLGRILGPAGKMPSPKAGTVVDDIATAVREYAAGKIEFRNDDGGNVHVPVGKLSFEDKRLVENIETMLARLRAMKPSSTKGAYMQKACISATMTPAIGLLV
jgi:large subunit ribosomal protein L1